MQKTLVVESEFLENLFITQSDNSTRKDLYEFITKDFSQFDLICDFENYEEFSQAILENPIWENIIDKVNKIEYSPQLDVNSICKGQGNLNHSIFLISDDTLSTTDLQNNFGLLFISYQELEQTWKKYIDLRKGKHFKITKSELIPVDSKLDCWSKLEDYVSPSNGVIIFDKYILNNKTNQALEKNLLPLLEMIIEENKGCEIDISIISEPKEHSYCIKKRHKEINNHLNKKGLSNFNLNIIKHYKIFYPRNFEGLHSRFILSNYFHYKCDDSFNFFKNNGKVNNDADLHINFCLDQSKSPFYNKELNDLKLYLSKISNNANSPKPEHKLMFYPNKSNVLLN